MKRSLWLSLYSKINGINILYISDHWYQKNKILGLFFPYILHVYVHVFNMDQIIEEFENE